MASVANPAWMISYGVDTLLCIIYDNIILEFSICVHKYLGSPGFHMDVLWHKALGSAHS